MSEPADNAHAPGNRTLLTKLVVVAVLMFGFGWALVPIYRKICEITGINLLTSKDPQTEAAAANTQVDRSRKLVVEFDANKQGPWRFKPSTNALDVHPGELVAVEYDLVNLEQRAMAGQAIPSFAPMQAAQYFRKIECFCFKQQKLEAGETRRFQVVFFVDPQLPRDVTQITLSYTFFEVPGATQAAAEARP
jgi:cytochrome c oxidase assembly protein subunit 11